MALSDELLVKKKRLDFIWERVGILENKIESLEEALKAVRSSVDAIEGCYTKSGSENEATVSAQLDPIQNDLDNALEKITAYQKVMGDEWETLEQEQVVLDATPGVLCRCHGETECEEQAAGQPAPVATVTWDGFSMLTLGEGKTFEHGLYRVAFLYKNDTGFAQGANGTIITAAEKFWEKHGFDTHGSYKHVLSQCERLKTEAEAAREAVAG